MKKSPALSAWADINSLLRVHKLINLGFAIICILQIFIIGVLILDDPIVVIKDGQEQKYYNAKKMNIPITEDAIKDFVKGFLKIRYEWSELEPKVMKKELTPLVTGGLAKKLNQVLTNLKENEFQGKSTSQSIVNIEVSVTDEEVIASFDKLLKIEGIPIPVPTTVSLHIIRDTPNLWNPIGLLVNGIKEHQSK